MRAPSHGGPSQAGGATVTPESPNFDPGGTALSSLSAWEVGGKYPRERRKASFSTVITSAETSAGRNEIGGT